MASLLSWVGNAAKKVERQINPFDGGATASHPAAQPQRPVFQPQRPVGPQLQVQQVQQPRLTITPLQLRPIQTLPVTVATPRPLQVGNKVVMPSPQARTGVLPPQTAAQPIRISKVQAQLNAARAAGQVKPIDRSFQHAVQATARTVPEAVTSLQPRQFTYHPQSALEKAAFGSTPVQNIQKKVVTNYQAHPNLNPAERIGLAGLEGVGSIAQDAPIIGKIAEGAKVGSELGLKGLKIANEARVPLGANKLADMNVGAVGKDVTKGKQVKLPIKVDATAEQKVADANPLKTKTPNIPLKEPVNDNLLTHMDTIIAQSTGSTPQDAARIRIQGQRNADAERAALDHLSKGGTRDEATKLYQQTARVTQKQAKFRVQQVAKETNQALHPNASGGVNPELANFPAKSVAPGDYTAVAQKPGVVRNLLNIHEKNSLDAVNKLAPDDRANFIHYAQGTEDISKAKDPVSVQAAVDTFRKGANTAHALDTNLAGGKTRFIKDFFPDYVDHADAGNRGLLRHKAEQAVEEQVGPDAWNAMGKGERDAALSDYVQKGTEDTGNYTGFRNRQRIFANRKEIIAAKLKPMFEDPAQDIKRYFAGAKINIGDQALIKAAREADANEPLVRNSIDLPTGPSFQVSDNALKSLKQFQRKTVTPIQKAARSANTSVIKTIVANPIFHGGNQEFNAVLQGATRMPGNKVQNVLKVIRQQANITEEDRYNFYKEGNFSPTYGKDNLGFIAKGLQKARIGPGVTEFSPQKMAAIEENIRVSLWKLGKERELSPAENTKIINQVLGGPELQSDMASSVGLFLHYFTNNVKLLGDIGNRARKGDVAPLVGLAVGTAAWVGATKAWQAATGNPNSSVRAPGVLGVGLSLLKAPGQLEKGKIPSVVTNHINPFITTGVSQATNRDLKRPIIGKSAQYNSLDGKYGSGRLKTATSSLVGPAGTAQDVMGGKVSLPYAATGLGLGLYNNNPAPNSATSGASGTSSGPQLSASQRIAQSFTTPEDKKFLALSSTDQKSLAATDPNARQLYDRINAAKTAFSSPPLHAQGLSPQDAQILDKYGDHGRVTPEAKQKFLANDPAGEYKLAQAKYNNDKLSGKLTTVQDIRAQDALTKAKVGSGYTKDIRDLYGLSNADLYNYVSNNSDGNAIVKKVLDYGDALKAAGVVSKNKFRDKYGSVSLKDPSASSSGRSVKVAKLKAPKAFKQSSFKVKTAKAPSFKTKRNKIPKYLAQTPKVKKTKVYNV